MTNKEMLKKVSSNRNRGESWRLFKNNKPPGKRQIEKFNKYQIPIDCDSEIRNIVIQLNENKIKTFGSCAGHIKGKRKGFITTSMSNKKLIRNIFKKNNIPFIYIKTKIWSDMYAVEFMSVGKTKDNYKKNWKEIVDLINYEQRTK